MVAFLGLDIGTQGARALVCAVPEQEGQKGWVVARAAQSFPRGTIPSSLPPGYVEQSPTGWWQAAVACLRQVAAQVPPETICALSVTSTSGTLCLLDSDGAPLIPALMYNDARATKEAVDVQIAGADLSARLGYCFKSSFALAKLLWLARHRPQEVDRARYVVHAADFISGHLSGRYRLQQRPKNWL